MQRLRTLTLLLVLGLFAGPAFAQPETPPIVPLEPQVDSPEEVIGTLILVDESASQVLNLLETITGKIILRRQDIQVKINFNSNGPLTRSEAVLALESLLTLNGVMLTDMGGKFMKAVPATDVNRHVPQMLAESTIGLPPSQQIYAKLFPLDYLVAEEANTSIVAPLLSPNSGVVIFPKSNALLITDALLNLQRIESILTEADQAQTIRESIHFIKLDYVQATELQDRIENLIQGPLKAYLEGNTSVTADERSNQLIIITHPSNMPVLQEVIENIDVDAAPLTATEVFQLKQAKAEEVVPIIENIISGQEEGREEDAKVSRDSNTNKKTANKNEQAPVAQNANPTTIASESSSTLQFSNFVGLSADERTNSIVAFGTKSDLKNISDLIEKIDIPLAQVLVEAVITQVFLSDKQTSGISSLGFTYDGATNTFTDIALGTVDGISISDGILDLDNPSDFSLTTAISVNSDDNSESDTRVLSTPRIIVSHNEEGIINVSRSQPIITSSTTFSSSEGNTRDSVEYRDIGLKLTVTPLIGADGTVQLEVEQLIESIVDEVQVNENDQPVIGKREATSTVSIKDGQIIILGGLQENSGGSNQTYFPMVGRLPVIKSIFGPRGKTYERTEIIIFLRPKILRNPAEAGRVSDEYLDIAQENKYIKRYIETESTGDIYIEESNIVKKFESLNDEEPTEPEEESEQEEEPADEKEGRGLLHFNL